MGSGMCVEHSVRIGLVFLSLVVVAPWSTLRADETSAARYEVREVASPQASCEFFGDEETDEFERDKCRCREAAEHELYVCHPHGDAYEATMVPVWLVVGAGDDWHALPVARAFYRFVRGRSDIRAETWIGRQLEVVEKRAGTWLIDVHYYYELESFVHLLPARGEKIPHEAMWNEMYNCRAGLAVAVEMAGDRPSVKGIMDRDFSCERGASEFGPDLERPHPWFYFPEIDRTPWLDRAGRLVAGGIRADTCGDDLRVFPGRRYVAYEHFMPFGR